MWLSHFTRTEETLETSEPSSGNWRGLFMSRCKQVACSWLSKEPTDKCGSTALGRCPNGSLCIHRSQPAFLLNWQSIRAGRALIRLKSSPLAGHEPYPICLSHHWRTTVFSPVPASQRISHRPFGPSPIASVSALHAAALIDCLLIYAASKFSTSTSTTRIEPNSRASSPAFLPRCLLYTSDAADE